MAEVEAPVEAQMDRPHGMAPHTSWPWATPGAAASKDVQIKAKVLLQDLAREREGRELTERRLEAAKDRREAARLGMGLPQGGRSCIEILNESMAATRRVKQWDEDNKKKFNDTLQATEAEMAALAAKREKLERELEQARRDHDDSVRKHQEKADGITATKVSTFDKKNAEAMQRSAKVLDEVAKDREARLKAMATKRDAELARANAAKEALDAKRAEEKLKEHMARKEKRELKDWKAKTTTDMDNWRKTREEGRRSRAQHIEALNNGHMELRKKLRNEYISRVESRTSAAHEAVDKFAKRLAQTHRAHEQDVLGRTASRRDEYDQFAKGLVDRTGKQTKALETMRKTAERQRVSLQGIQREQIRERYYATELAAKVEFRKKLMNEERFFPNATT